MNVSFIICNVECIAIHNTYENDICHYACVYVRLFFVSVYVCLSVWVYVCMYLCLSLSIHVYDYLWIHILFSELANAHMHVYPSIYLHACQYMEHACVVMRLCVYVCTSPDLSVCMYTMYARYITILYEIFIYILECIAKHVQDMDVLFAFCKWIMVNSILEV